jgi:hypothetical protein
VATQSSISRRSLLNYIGIAIIIAGMATGEFIYWRSLGNDSISDDPTSLYESRVYEQTVERTVGVFGLLMDQWSRSFAKLKEPRPQAIAIVVISLVAAGGCFLVASRMPRD